jgi:hypothetical protein
MIEEIIIGVVIFAIFLYVGIWSRKNKIHY